MKTENVVYSYRQKAKEYIENNFPDSVIRNEYGIKNPDHIKDLAASVMLTRDKIMMGGSFVKAVVNGNLDDAIGHADEDAGKSLKILVTVKHNCFI